LCIYHDNLSHVDKNKAKQKQNQKYSFIHLYLGTQCTRIHSGHPFTFKRARRNTYKSSKMMNLMNRFEFLKVNLSFYFILIS